MAITSTLRWVPVAVALPLLAAVCGAARLTPEPERTVEPGAVFTLAPGGSARLAGTDLTVTFEGVGADSRCPVGVQCVWEGDATVKISDGAATHELHTSEGAVRSVRTHGHELELVDLTPARRADAAIEAADYRAGLRIR
ncbi:hypothetical protein [Actinomadura macrotermitis]|uniref:Lipoprotein n=1 Tax=Actinomadura macrotermitis TaxID=2585200 RepID=A0A7K0C7G4_9ACTN|nr:hypothetical protein [Actinomadura macrotermitis]MQY09375.1 hypothetical protein [Actinomadura macrotermitis]